MNAPARPRWRRAIDAERQRLASAAADRAQAAVAVGLDDPQRQPHPPQPRRAEGRRPPGVLRLGDLDHDGAVFRDAAPAGPRRGEAACRPGVPRHQLPVRPPDASRRWQGLRQFGGAQSYPSRVKDGPEVDFSTGSVGLGVAHDQLLRADGRTTSACTASAAPTCRPAATSPSPATPNSTRATSTRRCWRAGSTTSAMSGGSSTTTARASTAWCPTGCSAASRACSATWAGTSSRMKYGRKLEAAFAREGGEELRALDRRLPEQPLFGADLPGRRRVAAGACWPISAAPSGVRAIIDPLSDDELGRADDQSRRPRHRDDDRARCAPPTPPATSRPASSPTPSRAWACRSPATRTTTPA